MRLSRWSSSDDDDNKDRKQNAKPETQLATMAAGRPVQAPSASPSPTPPSPPAKKTVPTPASSSAPQYKVYAVPFRHILRQMRS
ncbi:unnamed protein product [Heligmosomoides polygyrus]|uniref:Uncharacterized protein n=1 Tax=Heligmosomoides polygyrus TaxID=6339 RepID=A0A183FGF9_HELPZ|nr:unnamed protein product [Heligmosomoides polygyrus]